MRRYEIKTAKKYSSRIVLTFTEESTGNVPLSLDINLLFCDRAKVEKGLLKKLKPGDILQIEGSHGDEPVQLASPDPIANMYLETIDKSNTTKLTLLYQRL